MRQITASEVQAWVRDELLSPARTRPVVALTTHPSSGGYLVDPAEADARLGPLADVVGLETGDATWALTDALPDRLDVYGGAIRIWWPGLGEGSNPYDHRLYLVHSREHGSKLLAAVEHELARRVRPRPEPPVEVVVRDVEKGAVVEASDGRRGPLTAPGTPSEALAACLEPGQTLRAVPGRARADGTTEFSLDGLTPGPWARIAQELEPGEVVLGRVQHVRAEYALVDILPGATGIVAAKEVDWTFVRDVGQFVKPGELVRVQVLDVDPDAGRARLSIKRAQTADGPPRPSPSLIPGGRPFDWRALQEARTRLPAEEEAEEESGIGLLTDELEAVLADRAQLRRQVTDLRAALKSAEDRLQALERRLAPELDPLSSEPAFLLAVRLAYARMCGEGDRFEFPLQRMRVGPVFLERVRRLDGVELDKVVEVAAQVGCDKARTIPAREVHPLREGPGGSGQRTRARDGAKAWRCALQIHTPSARRLHWWRVPGRDGAVIELASVGLHDDVEIPE